MDTAVAPANPEWFINRELSQIEFNRRVLEQAKDPDTPLLERLKFLCISCTNLDEFFEVRVASLKQRLKYGANKPGIDGHPPAVTLAQIRERSLDLVDDQYRTFHEVLSPALASEGIRFLRRDHWTKSHANWLEQYFLSEVLPVLSPLGLDPVHPFPRILNKSLNFAVVLEGTDAFGREGNLALVRAPRSLPRVVRIPDEHTNGRNDFVFLSSIVHAFVAHLFTGMTIRGCYQFRVTRNSELYVDEEEVENLAQALKGELLERNFASPVRLEVAQNCTQQMTEYLTDCFGLESDDVYPCNGPVNLNRLIEVYDLIHRPDLKDRAFKPCTQVPLQGGGNYFSVIQQRDILLHHPFDSFLPIIDLLKQAVADHNVLAIKQTLYRTGRDSPIVSLLIDAARLGKDVTAVIELRARFDEQENIDLANQLQEAGVQVVYGIVGHKTHAKLLLMVRREGSKLTRYAHLGTGNYHHRTAAAYTDLGLLTCNQDITRDVHELFQQLTGIGKLINLSHLYQSPFTLHQMLLDKIRHEADIASQGQPAKIIARMNALTEPEVISALYEASQAGVEIQLLIRSACCLKPGIEGISENIQVRSVVGRFLEHSRVYYFHNGGSKPGESIIFGSSADWMERNLFSRVESCFPIDDPELAERVKRETLDYYMQDNVQAWILQPDGSYVRAQRSDDEHEFCAQEQLMQEAESLHV